jgi:hypothetical protein
MFHGNSMVSGSNFPLNQSIDIGINLPQLDSNPFFTQDLEPQKNHSLGKQTCISVFFGFLVVNLFVFSGVKQFRHFLKLDRLGDLRVSSMKLAGTNYRVSHDVFIKFIVQRCFSIFFICVPFFLQHILRLQQIPTPLASWQDWLLSCHEVRSFQQEWSFASSSEKDQCGSSGAEVENDRSHLRRISRLFLLIFFW